MLLRWWPPFIWSHEPHTCNEQMRDPAKPLQQAGARVFNRVFKEMTRCDDAMRREIQEEKCFTKKSKLLKMYTSTQRGTPVCLPWRKPRWPD